MKIGVNRRLSMALEIATSDVSATHHAKVSLHLNGLMALLGIAISSEIIWGEMWLPLFQAGISLTEDALNIYRSVTFSRLMNFQQESEIDSE